ncbi:MAG: hypothetical protein ACRDPK_10015 [Carbonactinosporaceae bacterium]
MVDEEIGHAGGETHVGPWRIGYIVEAAEPWYRHGKAGEVFRPPAKGETHHIEVLPIEAATGRIVPDVPIRVEVVDASGDVVDARRLNFYYSGPSMASRHGRSTCDSSCSGAGQRRGRCSCAAR